MGQATTLRENLSRCLRYLLVTAIVSQYGFLANGESSRPVIRHLAPSNLDAVLGCVHDVFAKPAIWDASVRFWTDLPVPPCPGSQSALRELFAAHGVSILDAGDFVFVIASKLFQPPVGGTEPPHAFLKWRTINIHLNLQSLVEGGALPQDAAEIAKQIVDQARMVPFAVAKANNDGFPVPGAVDTNLNIALWAGPLGPGKDRSLVAVVNGRPTFSTARLVYGEFRSGKFVMLWDSPLFNVLHGHIYFQDVNGDGSKEIVIESTTYGNQEYPMLVIFDTEGREITRQRKCDTGADDNMNEETGTCAVLGEEITISNNGEGPRDIYVRNWDDGQNHVFKLSGGVYVPGPPMMGDSPAPLSEKTPDAAKANEDGIKLMRAKDYASAELKFQQASLLSGDKNAEYANNAGFALYKEAKYDLAIAWIQKAIDLDPKRAVAYLNLGDACAGVNRNAEARQAYLKYLELAPDSKLAPEVKKKLETLSTSP